MNNDNQEKLKKYRAELDKIDDKIHSLLMERTHYAKKISQAKGQVSGLAIRPEREAEIHRRLYKNHTGEFPYTSLARIWCEMVNAFTLMQSEYKICVYVKDNDMRCWELARDQFGSVVEIILKDNIADVIASAENDSSTIAVIPASEVCELDKTNIILRLPFSIKRKTIGSNYDAFALAQLKPVASGIDKTVMFGDKLPDDCEKITEKDGKIFYVIDGFSDSDNVIGAYPNGIGE